MKKWIYLSVLFLLLFMYSVEAEKAEIRIEHVGFGERTNKVYISISNVGDVPLTGIEIWVDGTKRLVIDGKLNPQNILETVIFLDPGKHFIEAKTSEGAYDFLNITISPVVEKKVEIKKEKQFSLEDYRVWIFLFILLVLIVLIFSLFKNLKAKKMMIYPLMEDQKTKISVCLISFLILFILLVGLVSSTCTPSNPCCCENKCWISGTCCKKGTPEEYWSPTGCFDFKVWIEPTTLRFTVGRWTPINLYLKNIEEYSDRYNVTYWIESANPSLVWVDTSGITPTDILAPGEVKELKPRITVLSTSASGVVWFNISSWGDPGKTKNVSLTIIQSDLPVSLPEFGFFRVLMILFVFIIFYFIKINFY